MPHPYSLLPIAAEPFTAPTDRDPQGRSRKGPYLSEIAGAGRVAGLSLKGPA